MSEKVARFQMYPVVLDLAGRRCLVAGGGTVALRKARDLLDCGADVTAVAPEWSADVTSLAGEARFHRLDRPFAPADLEGVFLAVAATGDAAVQRAVAAGARARGILVNVVDVPDLCAFFVPASLRRGSLVVSVSTEGRSPFFAVAVRDRLAAALDPEVGAGLELLARGREIVRERYAQDAPGRRAALARLHDPENLDALMEGRLGDFEARWRSWKASLAE